uniref:Zn(2)-C6 fungal-type domain-containing protein n=1 Tax=Mycena chlorophos TaxID=658473 RepID=A0ABQ0M7D4_MYCCL|nr:predicted protein [Mycena chlorophos]
MHQPQQPAPASMASPSSSPGGPVFGKASKACSRCRHDKTWCNGALPSCSACTQKGVQCTEGCLGCRQARSPCVKTAGNARCTRCTEQNIACTDSTEAPRASTSVPEPTPGAVSCRACDENNLQCDQQRPCSHCVSQNTECVTSSTVVPEPPKPRATSKPVSSKLRNPCVPCEKDQIVCDEAQPSCSNCVAGQKQCFVSVKQKSQRTKMACVACRKQKIRCNGERPCHSCVRKDQPCINSICQTCVDEGKRKCKHRFEAGGTSDKATDPTQAPALAALVLPPPLPTPNPPPPKVLPSLSMIISDAPSVL